MGHVLTAALLVDIIGVRHGLLGVHSDLWHVLRSQVLRYAGPGLLGRQVAGWRLIGRVGIVIKTVLAGGRFRRVQASLESKECQTGCYERCERARHSSSSSMTRALEDFCLPGSDSCPLI